MKWVFVAHSLWRDTLLSLDTGEEELGPVSSDVIDIVDSPWEASPSRRGGCCMGWGEGRRSGKTGGRGNWCIK